MNAPLIASPAAEALVNAAFENNLAEILALLGNGVDVNQQDDFGSTALHWAAEHRNVEMVQALLSRGADVHLKDQAGEDAFYMAADYGQGEVLRLLEDAVNNRKT